MLRPASCWWLKRAAATPTCAAARSRWAVWICSLTTARSTTCSCGCSPPGQAFRVVADEEVLDRFYDGRLMRRLLTYVRPYWATVAAAGVLLALAAGLQVIGPLLTRTAVDRYMAPVPGAAPTALDLWLPQDRWSGLVVISTTYFVVLLLTGVCDFAQ